MPIRDSRVTPSDREVDFRYGPRVVQTCIGGVDDEHKTIVHEDGSLC
jgi:hypothetical protein